MMYSFHATAFEFVFLWRNAVGSCKVSVERESCRAFLTQLVILGQPYDSSDAAHNEGLKIMLKDVGELCENNGWRAFNYQ